MLEISNSKLGTAAGNKEEYRKLCEREPCIPLFSQHWWLDATCGASNWDVVLYEKGGLVFGALPFFRKKFYGFTMLTQPMLTQVLGPWIKYPDNQKMEKRLSHEKKVIGELVRQLPAYSIFRQNLHYSMQNWLPFHWLGFEQTSRATYVLRNLQNLDDVWREMQPRIKTDIRKAEKNGVRVVDTEDLSKLLKVNAMTFNRQNTGAPYSDQLVENLDAACRQRGCRKIFLAVDQDQEVHAGLYLVWDQSSAYYLLGGANPEIRSSGASSLLVWEAIKYSSEVSRVFDFEGSMLEPVENFVRGFGAEQMLYHAISKIKTKPLALAICINKLLSR